MSDKKHPHYIRVHYATDKGGNPLMNYIRLNLYQGEALNDRYIPAKGELMFHVHDLNRNIREAMQRLGETHLVIDGKKLKSFNAIRKRILKHHRQQCWNFLDRQFKSEGGE